MIFYSAFVLIIWLILTTDASSVVTCVLHAAVVNLFLMYLNQFFMFFSVVIYSSISMNCPNHFVISYIFNISFLSIHFIL